MMTLAWQWMLLALPLPILYRIAMRPRPMVSGAIRFPMFAEAAGVLTRHRGSRLALALASLGWIALVLASARPQWVDEQVELPASGRDLLLAVDISGSMETADLYVRGRPATRLKVVKSVVGEFLERRAGDRVGLILFGRRAYLQTPLTFDRATTRQLLEEAVIGLAGKETAIGDAIGLAVKDLREQPHDEKVLILLTDGANTAGSIAPLQAARLAEQENIKVYTVGVGSDKLTISSPFGTRRVNPSAELDEPTLQAIAAQTGGQYFRARDTAELEEIYTVLDQLEPVVTDENIVRPRRDLYHLPLGLAMLFGVAAWLLSRFRGGR